MTTPLRIAILDRDGFDLQVWSRLHNGLPAIKVCGATNFETPYRGDGPAALRVALYRDMTRDPDSRKGRWVRDNVHTLRGHNLACTCAAGQPCHGDVLLVLANRAAGVTHLEDVAAAPWQGGDL